MAHFQTSTVIAVAPAKIFEYFNDFKNFCELFHEYFEVIVENEKKVGTDVFVYDIVLIRWGVRWSFTLKKLRPPGTTMTFKQIKGPFRKWAHTLIFESHGSASTTMTDVVEYSLPFGLLGHLVSDLYFRSHLEKMFLRKNQVLVYRLLGASRD